MTPDYIETQIINNRIYYFLNEAGMKKFNTLPKCNTSLSYKGYDIEVNTIAKNISITGNDNQRRSYIEKLNEVVTFIFANLNRD